MCWVLIVSVLARHIGVCLARRGGSPLPGHADGDLLRAQVPLGLLSTCLFTSCFRTEDSSQKVGRWLQSGPQTFHNTLMLPDVLLPSYMHTCTFYTSVLLYATATSCLGFPYCGYRQQVVKSEAHIARVLSSDVLLSDLEQSSKRACTGMNDIITCISIC